MNSIATTKGGTHVNYVVDQVPTTLSFYSPPQVVDKLIEAVNKKNKAAPVKPFQVKNHLWVFVNCLVENPTFDSQTKENMTLKVKAFGSECSLSDKFMKGVLQSGVVESILTQAVARSQAQLAKASGSGKRARISGIAKLDDANEAGGRNSEKCTLILTEGDSAKALAVSGLSVVGRDYFGVFPLRGKLLNVREASHKQIMDNAEIKNVVQIMVTPLLSPPPFLLCFTLPAPSSVGFLFFHHRLPTLMCRACSMARRTTASGRCVTGA